MVFWIKIAFNIHSQCFMVFNMVPLNFTPVPLILCPLISNNFFQKTSFFQNTLFFLLYFFFLFHHSISNFVWYHPSVSKTSYHRQFINPMYIVKSLRILSCGFHFTNLHFRSPDFPLKFEYFFQETLFFPKKKNFFYIFSFFTTLFQISFYTIHPCPKGVSQILS